jgi:hypothetical protein
MIDEQFRPVVKEDSIYITEPRLVLVEEMVEKDMIVKGLNPLNKDDVNKYWASKGVGV